MLSRQTLLTLTIISGLLILGAGVGIFTSRYYSANQTTTSIPGLLWPDPKQLIKFDTIDHNGVPFGLDRLQGKWSLLFFGYTHCPDVCPLTMTVLSSLQDRLPAGIQTVFITIDPVRDTTARLAEYIGYFDSRFIALGGSIEQVNSLTAQIGIVWSHGAPETDGSYPVSHTGSVFLLDPAARLVGIFSAPHQADTLLSGVSAIHDFIDRQD